METLKDVLDAKGRRVWSVRPDDTVERALSVLNEANIGALLVMTGSGDLVGVFSERIRHLPVYDNERLEGMVSIGDVVKAMVQEKNLVIDQLEHYIESSL